MLHPLRHQLNPMRIVLASGSPRRQELIQNLVSFMTKIIKEIEII